MAHTTKLLHHKLNTEPLKFQYANIFHINDIEIINRFMQISGTQSSNSIKIGINQMLDKHKSPE